MVGVTRKISKGQSSEIEISGPTEVQKLGSILQEMIASVEASQRSQREFVSNISHELRTPLTSVQGFSQVILDGTARDPETLHHAAKLINSKAGCLQRLANGLVDLARLEHGTVDLQSGMIDLSELLGGIVEKLAPQIQAKCLVVTLTTGGLPKIYGDGDRLAQVFLNLLDNAIKFTPPGGKIELTAYRIKDAVNIRVVDSGPGISLEDQKGNFERLYQVEKSTRGGAGRGIGLELPIAQQIVIAHGGQILLESSPGQGATFTVQIPVDRENL
ncbi:MAG: HAMP domain-containing histidine kinase [Anaerolineae bacterium]|nr:HAMP domain-containing histidine kinase [Anaerolineae bacterium]